MQSEGPRGGEGGGAVEIRGGRGRCERGREGGTGSRNRKGRRGGGRLPATAAAVWVSLHSLAGWVPAPSPTRPGKWVTEGRSSSPTLAKEHPARESRDHLLFAAFSPSFLEGFMFVLSPLKLCSFEFFPPQLGFDEGFVKS